MAVRAKFTVSNIGKQLWTKWQDGKAVPTEILTVKLNPVCDDTPENKLFWEATPSGSIELGTVNAAAGNQFELGKTYYVDFTPAE